MPDYFYTTGGFTFQWDDDKNKINIKKHGIDFETAALVFNDDLRLEIKDRKHPDENRFITIGLVYDVLFVSYCDRINSDTGNTDIRIISARLADEREIKAYNNNILGRI